MFFEQTDQTLVDKALDGSERAWIKLVKRYEKAIYNYALRMTSDADQAFDLMQETFMSVNRSLANYRGEGSFKAWIFRIANFRCIEFYRKRKHFDDINEIDEPQADIQSSPEFITSQGQQSGQLMDRINLLPVEQKLVVELKFYQQFTFDEIAEQLNVSSNTVKSRLYAALGKLKQSLEGQDV